MYYKMYVYLLLIFLEEKVDADLFGSRRLFTVNCQKILRTVGSLSKKESRLSKLLR